MGSKVRGMGRLREMKRICREDPGSKREIEMMDTGEGQGEKIGGKMTGGNEIIDMKMKGGVVGNIEGTDQGNDPETGEDMTMTDEEMERMIGRMLPTEIGKRGQDKRREVRGTMEIGRTEGEMKDAGETGTEMTEEVMERTERRIQDGGEMKIRTRVRRGERNLVRGVNGGKTPHPVTPVTRYSFILKICHSHLCSTNV